MQRHILDEAGGLAFLLRLDAIVRATSDGLALLDVSSRHTEVWSALPSSIPGEEVRSHLLDWTKDIEAGTVIAALVADLRARYE